MDKKLPPCLCSMHRQPAHMLFSEPIDFLRRGGSHPCGRLAGGVSMPVIDSLGEEFLDFIKDTMTVTVHQDGTVTVE